MKEGKWPEILNYVKTLGWHVELHIDAVQLPPLIDDLLNAGVKIVVDHFSRPTAENLLEDEGFKYLLSVGNSQQIWVKNFCLISIKKRIVF